MELHCSVTQSEETSERKLSHEDQVKREVQDDFPLTTCILQTKNPESIENLIISLKNVKHCYVPDTCFNSKTHFSLRRVLHAIFHFGQTEMIISDENKIVLRDLIESLIFPLCCEISSSKGRIIKYFLEKRVTAERLIEILQRLDFEPLEMERLIKNVKTAIVVLDEKIEYKRATKITDESDCESD